MRPEMQPNFGNCEDRAALLKTRVLNKFQPEPSDPTRGRRFGDYNFCVSHAKTGALGVVL